VWSAEERCFASWNASSTIPMLMFKITWGPKWLSRVDHVEAQGMSTAWVGMSSAFMGS
jgi:hypothetical protein